MKAIVRIRYWIEAKKNIRLAVPIVVGQLGIILMGVVDTIIVGRIPGQSQTGLSVSGLGNGFFYCTAIFGLASLSVVASLVSTYVTEHRFKDCKYLVESGLMLAFILSLFSNLILSQAGYFYDWFGQSPALKSQTLDFLFYLDISSLPLFLFVALKGFVDGLEKTKVGMIINLIGLVINFLLNYVFIYGYFGIPAQGISGSAISTALTRVIMLGLMATYILYDKDCQKILRIKLQNTKSQLFSMLGYLFRLGIPSGLQGFFEIAAFVSAIMMMGWISETSIAAHQIAINMASTTFMMANGISIATSIRVGIGRGMHDRQFTRRAGTVGLWIVIIFMIICAIIFLLFPTFLVELYTKDVKVAQLAIILVFWAAVFQLSDGIQSMALGILRGLTDVTIPTWITFFSYWIIGLPIGYWMAFKLGWKEQGIWAGLTIGLTISAILLTLRFYSATQSHKFGKYLIRKRPL